MTMTCGEDKKRGNVKLRKLARRRCISIRNFNLLLSARQTGRVSVQQPPHPVVALPQQGVGAGADAGADA